MGTLLERRRKLLTEHFDNLRVSLMAARQRRPFTADAKGGMRFAFPPYGPISQKGTAMTRAGASDGALDSSPSPAADSVICRKLW
jgi:hypothetical protein